MRERNYVNDTPIDDVQYALKLLIGERRSSGELRVQNPEPYLAEYIYCGPYDSCNNIRYYRVTSRLVRSLREEGYVEGTPQWGYTDDTRLRISSRGRSYYWEMKEPKTKE
ncbi:MAG: hypothetical protein KGI50_01375 [Patescibacteria group bacterium]|nr:hypothetical protein [Patescibacteria group bacterium]MDE2438001.1 hypothetical protein [Patescibacteria group bacterium]